MAGNTVVDHLYALLQELQAVFSSPGHVSLSIIFTASLAAVMVEASTTVDSELFLWLG